MFDALFSLLLDELDQMRQISGHKDQTNRKLARNRSENRQEHVPHVAISDEEHVATDQLKRFGVAYGEQTAIAEQFAFFHHVRSQSHFVVEDPPQKVLVRRAGHQVMQLAKF